MTDKEAIYNIELILDRFPLNDEQRQALKIAIGAIKRDNKVDDITFHWNDKKSNFVAACNAFEDILKVYGRGV
jgi:hypothetical protein